MELSILITNVDNGKKVKIINISTNNYLFSSCVLKKLFTIQYYFKKHKSYINKLSTKNIYMTNIHNRYVSCAES